MSIRSTTLRALGVGATVASTALLLTAIAGPAAASTTSANGASPAQYCAVVVGKGATPSAVSPTLAQACSTVSMHAATTKLDRQAATGAVASPQLIHPDKGALLMTWYQNKNYNSGDDGSQTNIYAGGNIGGGDTCDSAGYKLSPSIFWSTNLSSAVGNGNCNEARFYDINEDYARTFNVSNRGASYCPYVGDKLNDNVGRIQVYA